MTLNTSSVADVRQDQDRAEILFARRGDIGVITLNRPQALNALTLAMVRAMNTQLSAWAADDDVQAVVVCGGGDRAFCAGGDVKSVALAVRAQDPDVTALARDFFYEEYTLNHRIFTYPKPYIALINGIVMGGGVGISAHGAFRIVGENTTLAMPETRIGFFPDVGGGYFLPRCPGQTGTYLALTGHSIGAVDAIYCGFATHYVPVALHEDLLAALADSDLKDAVDCARLIEDIIAGFAQEEVPGQSHLAPARDVIDECFGGDSVEAIVAALSTQDSDFAAYALQSLYAVSPTSLKVTLRQLRLGETLHFAKVMTMEYRLSQTMLRHPDFYEGIRAALIDKDKQPRWRPARLDDITPGEVEAFFAPRPGDELVLERTSP